MAASVKLTASNLGGTATEADFDAWIAYVCARIDAVCGFEVGVESFRFGEAADRDVIRGTDAEREAIETALVTLWDEGCEDSFDPRPTAHADAFRLGTAGGIADVENVRRERGRETVVGTLASGQLAWDEGARNAGAHVYAGIPTHLEGVYYEAYAAAARARAEEIAAETALVVIETMPDFCRGSHRAAGNWGVYPRNGATRQVVTREEAAATVAADRDGYDRIVRDATAKDIAAQTDGEE